MKFIVIKNNFKEGVLVVEKIINGSNINLPILKNVRISTEENKIKLTSTNLEIAVTCVINGKVIENGEYTVPISILSNTINNIQNERLNIEKQNNKLQIKTDNYSAKIQGLPADEFPLTPKIKNQEEYIKIKAEILKNAFNQILTATQPSELRPELNSILFNFSLNAIKLVGTDSFRLAEKTIYDDQFTANYKKQFTLLLPLKTIQELVRILKNDQDVKIYFDENQINFKTEQWELLSRLIEGTFPDYSAIIPKKFSLEINVSRKEFINALKLVGVFSGKNNEVKLSVGGEKNVIELTASDQSTGENNYLLSAKINGEKRTVIFNWRYINDALNILESEEVFLGINGDDEPAEIKSPGDGSYIYILKPIIPV